MKWPWLAPQVWESLGFFLIDRCVINPSPNLTHPYQNTSEKRQVISELADKVCRPKGRPTKPGSIEMQVTITDKKKNIIWQDDLTHLSEMEVELFMDLCFVTHPSSDNVKSFWADEISIAELSRCPSGTLRHFLILLLPGQKSALWDAIKNQYKIGGISKSGIKALTRAFGFKVKFNEKKKQEKKKESHRQDRTYRQQRTYRAPPPPSRRSPWEVLGVSPLASCSEIKNAYRRLAFEHHPDRNKGSTESEAKFKEINNAYQRAK